MSVTNVIYGLELSSYSPSEVIIVHMNEPTYAIESSLLIKQFTFESVEPLPLAAARNYAASLSSSNILIFLDVDCIPERNCFEALLQEDHQNAICMADPYYLPYPIERVSFKAFKHIAKPSIARSELVYGVSERYELFWSLGFLISKSTYNRIGGFDEAFIGYGAEDTDFAFTARKKKVPLIYSRAKVYHQPHPSYDPPLNWLQDIIRNAELFYSKWGIWPMKGWLDSFEVLGYITFENNCIKIVKVPTKDEIKHAQL
jgi:N-acetylglucosaminyl-diphospho-decaprenol L-rhamnosyltransferase